MKTAYLVLALVFITHTAMALTTEPTATQKSIAEIKQELNKEKDPKKNFYLLSDLVQNYASEKLTSEIARDAKQSAESLLKVSEKFKSDWNYGNALHHSHLVLGRLNLLDGKIEEAKAQLKLAGEIKGSPQLNTFGPNMTLAKELLEKNEKTSVLEYFDKCLAFWKSDSAKPTIAQWKADIAKGKTPEFKANLVY